jgi:hypothetical protein
MTGTLKILVHIGSYQVVPIPVAGDSLVKVFYVLKILNVIELIFDSSMYRLNITVIAPDPHRNYFVPAAEALEYFFKTISGSILPETTHKLFAAVGLELQLSHINTWVTCGVFCRQVTPLVRSSFGLNHVVPIRWLNF